MKQIKIYITDDNAAFLEKLEEEKDTTDSTIISFLLDAVEDGTIDIDDII